MVVIIKFSNIREYKKILRVVLRNALFMKQNLRVMTEADSDWEDEFLARKICPGVPIHAVGSNESIPAFLG